MLFFLLLCPAVIPDSLKVASVAPPAEVPEGGPLELYCNASRDVPPQGYTHLSVTWSVAKGAGPEDVLSFGPDGGVAVGPSYAQRYADGALRLDLRGGGVYGLVLPEALPSDGGVYTCTAREWSPEVGGAWQLILEKSVEMGEVLVTPTGEEAPPPASGSAACPAPVYKQDVCTLNLHSSKFIPATFPNMPTWDSNQQLYSYQSNTLPLGYSAIQSDKQ